MQSITIDNIKGFTSCLQTVFLNTGEVATWIGRFANQDIRRSLQLTREIIASPHVGVGDLLESHLKRTAMIAKESNIKLAIIKGKYDIYPANSNSFVQNVYGFGTTTDTTPLLGLRILQFLKERWDQNHDNDARYVNIEDINIYVHAMGIEQHIVQIWLKAMLDTGLVLSYNPLIKEISSDIRLEISPSGVQHLLWGAGDWNYLESMAEVTPLLCQATVDKIKALLAESAAHLRREVIRTFIDYLLKEDSYFCKTPKHEGYLGQDKLIVNLKQKRELLDQVHGISGSDRYQRSLGRISTWNDEAGYGFIRPDVGNEEFFVHIKDIMNRKGGSPIKGTRVEFDIGNSKGKAKKPAIKVLEMN